MLCIWRLQNISTRRKPTRTLSCFYTFKLSRVFFDTVLLSARDAAMTIARLANHRNPHVAILALSLLDTLVQSCGYPFHLQISTKEFLNELVRRFPERPPPFPGPVMSRILHVIHHWKEGICVDSRWKEDLGNIRDMHRLLTFKGYRFKDLPKSTNAVTSVTAVCDFCFENDSHLLKCSLES